MQPHETSSLRVRPTCGGNSGGRDQHRVACQPPVGGPTRSRSPGCHSGERDLNDLLLRLACMRMRWWKVQTRMSPLRLRYCVRGQSALSSSFLRVPGLVGRPGVWPPACSNHAWLPGMPGVPGKVLSTPFENSDPSEIISARKTTRARPGRARSSNRAPQGVLRPGPAVYSEHGRSLRYRRPPGRII